MSTMAVEMASSKKQEADAELEELDVREVSIVDRPANKRRFLIVKRAGEPEEDMPNKVEVIKDEDSLLDLLGLGDAAGDSDITDEDETPEVTIEEFDLEVITKAAIAETMKVVNAMVGRLSKVVSTLKGSGGDKEAEKAEVSEKTLSEIQSIAKTLGALADKLGSDEKGDEKEAAKKADASTLAKVCGGALQQLMSVSAKLKGIDKGADEVPTAIVQTIGSVAVALAKAVSAGEKEPSKGGDKDAAKEPAKGGDKKDPTELRDKERAQKRLQIFVTKSDDEDPEIIIKAGAKMKRSRLNQFKKAVETLMSLLKELEGDQGGSDAKKDTKGVTKSEDSDSINEKLVKGFELLESKLGEKIAAALEPVTKRLDEIDNTVPPGNGDADATETKPEEVKKSGDGFWSSVFR